MADASGIRGGLDHLATRQIVSPDGTTIRIEPVTSRGLLWLRVRPDDAAVTGAIASVLGAPLPSIPNTTARLADGRLCWLGPDEWLVDIAGERADQLLASLHTATRGRLALIVAIGEGRACLSVTGTAAIDVLRKGCPLDLHPSAFARDACARTVLGRVGVFIVCIEPGAAYHVVVDRSYADPLWHWLAEAARELTGRRAAGT